MHIYFSGIGGTGIGPLALVALNAGYQVSGSDKQDSQYIHYLKQRGIENIHIGQSKAAISSYHDQSPIDWFVYTSALPLENPNAPELQFCYEQSIKTTKRDDLLNHILKEKDLSLLAIAGTHGKTTTTAMVVWLFTQLKIPLSYILPAKTSFGEMGRYDPNSKFFVYEADEFDRNFLAFQPFSSIITGVSWDHHEIFPTRDDYRQAFNEYISQCQNVFIWQEDADYLNINPSLDSFSQIMIEDSSNHNIAQINLAGFYNRLDAWLAIKLTHHATQIPIETLIKTINHFPGLQRRMEAIAPNLYSDYAHTPEKIRGSMSVAQEMATKNNQNIIVVYEPLTNRRQLYIERDYQDCFQGADHIYWLPSYLAREDPKQRLISPAELISYLDNPSIAEPSQRDQTLIANIKKHLNNNDMVVCMAGGGGNSLDEWIRDNFTD